MPLLHILHNYIQQAQALHHIQLPVVALSRGHNSIKPVTVTVGWLQDYVSDTTWNIGKLCKEAVMRRERRGGETGRRNRKVERERDEERNSLSLDPQSAS